jgi:hypothetical protein
MLNAVPTKNASRSKRAITYPLNSLTEKKPSAVKSISGMLKGKAPANLDWKKAKSGYLTKKHGL